MIVHFSEPGGFEKAFFCIVNIGKIWEEFTETYNFKTTNVESSQVSECCVQGES